MPSKAPLKFSTSPSSPLLGRLTNISSCLQSSTTTEPSINNCRELLDSRLQVKWQIEGEYIYIELSGRIQENEYMAFGISGYQGRPQMQGADVVVAFYDNRTRTFRAEDYYMSHLSQCDGKQGVCPDERIGGRNDVMEGKEIEPPLDFDSLT